MTAVTSAVPRRVRAGRRPAQTAARLMLLELRHSTMPWLLPVAIALFGFLTYRKIMAMPPLWSVRAAAMQSGALLDFACPVVGAAAWAGSREARRRTCDLLATTTRAGWQRMLTAWAAAALWAMTGYTLCVVAVYWQTARLASFGGPLWWPATVVAAALLALSALGFAAGTVLPGRLTAPLAAIASFFIIALSTELIVGSKSYWQVSPLVSAAGWDTGPDAGAGTFYHFLPDLPIAQVIFLTGLTIASLGALALRGSAGARRLRAAAVTVAAAGLLAAGTGVGLAGTGTLDSRGMIAIPALHDAASDQPLRYTAVCSRRVVPVCLNPAYARYLPAAVAAFQPVLSEIAGLPGAPVRVSQVAAAYRQGRGNSLAIMPSAAPVSGSPPVYHLLLPDQLDGPVLTTGELARQLASQVRTIDGPQILERVVGDGPGASAAQRAVAAALMVVTGAPKQGYVFAAVLTGKPLPAQGVRCPSRGDSCPVLEAGSRSPAEVAAIRFAALPASVRHAWLVRHLAALRAGHITVRQLP